MGIEEDHFCRDARKIEEVEMGLRLGSRVLTVDVEEWGRLEWDRTADNSYGVDNY